MAIDNGTFQTFDDIATPASPATNVSRVYSVGGQIRDMDGSGEVSSQPAGTWTILATGAISIANNTAVTAVTMNNIADGEMIVPMWPTVEVDTALNMYINNVNVSLGVTNGAFCVTKNTVADRFLLRVRQSTTAARSIRFTTYKVTLS
jgi:hypothetical protein